MFLLVIKDKSIIKQEFTIKNYLKQLLQLFSGKNLLWSLNRNS